MDCETKFCRSKEVLNNTTLLGNCQWRDRAITDQTPLEALAGANDIDELSHLSDSLTGFFSVVTRADNDWTIVTDCINSIPLYFKHGRDEVYITDSQQQLLEYCGELKIDPVSVAEYKNVAYVTTNSLLYESIYQTGPATITQFQPEEFRQTRYFNYRYADAPFHRSISDLKEMAKKVVQRCVDYADGRQIWVPLSGGLDSRLLLTAFADIGYQNLHAYTYGTMETEYSEPAVAQRVAQSLDVEWHFLEYTPEQWNEWYRTNDRYEYDRELFLSTVPMLKELPGIRSLLDNGHMDGNAVIVPGHTGDVLAGNYLTSYLYNNSYVSEKEMVDVILTRHYIDGFNEYNGQYEDEFKSRIQSSADYQGGTGVDAMEACDRWNWRERQGTWITSHVKQYEFYDLDWWMPMWDRDYVQFWMETEIEQRIGKTYYDEAVQSIYESAASDPEPAPEKTITDKMKIWAAGTRIEPYLRHVHRFVLNRNHSDPEEVYGWREGIMDYDTFEEMYNGDTSARSYRARLLLDEMDVR